MEEQELEMFKKIMDEMIQIVCESFIPEPLPQGEYIVSEGQRAYKVGGFITYD
jgi:hypothetical protein